MTLVQACGIFVDVLQIEAIFERFLCLISCRVVVLDILCVYSSAKKHFTIESSQ